MTSVTPGGIERALSAWLARRGTAADAIEPLAGDVSARRYFRLRGAAVAGSLAVYYPPELADAQRRFGRAATLLESVGVRVPRRHADDPEAGFALVEDLGRATLAERRELDWRGRAAWFELALEAARRIAGLPAAAVTELGNPPLDRALLERELDPVVDLLLGPRGLVSPPLSTALGDLCRELAAPEPVACHRDFMARNLVPLPEGEIGILDFQDLRLGPPTYDLASLLNDTLFAPEALERGWLERHLPAGSDTVAYGRAVVQRTLKAAGTFLRFAERGDGRHLPLVAPSLERAARHLRVLPETAAAFAPVEQRFVALIREVRLC